MSEPRLTDYILHIQEAAAVMCLLILGEASTQIMEKHTEFAQLHRDVPWQSMRNMRNRMAHGYFSISLQIVWETVHDDLPSLILKMKSLGTKQ